MQITLHGCAILNVSWVSELLEVFIKQYLYGIMNIYVYMCVYVYILINIHILNKMLVFPVAVSQFKNVIFTIDYIYIYKHNSYSRI